ncbi:hypothetical protein [Deinococcus cellulosilyticus]|uniref:Uncharacterized protein n=1 Tax=Deinococcus cellulosilyticus (strain DSM 18568 / NBRC 106333 / KACC 11606 / 5516J-15) TaxID=1223518 RepID=A0A511N0V1_DEIC1|nr:hypothetical protein [Deinococcus cellulosilyticus]GEM46492.1 hypothetical protein DC3_21270 [Deinococcus cellulosilyticus NBRC 106333 = KACC 11606]
MPVSMWFAGGFYLINFLLGLGLQMNLFRLRYRALHHVLYALVVLSCLWVWWEVRHAVLFLALLLWGLMPLMRPRRVGHVILPLVVGGLYLVFMVSRWGFYV